MGSFFVDLHDNTRYNRHFVSVYTRSVSVNYIRTIFFAVIYRALVVRIIPVPLVQNMHRAMWLGTYCPCSAAIELGH
jgi:hypothetical protein